MHSERNSLKSNSKYEPAIVDGTLNFFSPSSLLKFKECNRKWGFRYILRIREPQSKAAQIGSAGHERIEHYLKTGKDVLAPMERAGAPWIPKPNENLGVELDYQFIPQGGDVRCKMKIDALNGTGVWVDSSGNEKNSDIVEVIDWKFTGGEKNVKSQFQLATDLPMACYGVAASHLAKLDPSDRVRLSLVYFFTHRRDALKITRLVESKDCHAVLAKELPTIEAMKQAAKASHPNELEPNYKSCENWGGCHYREQCASQGIISHQAILRKIGKKEAMKSDTIETQSTKIIRAIQELDATGIGWPMTTNEVSQSLGSADRQPHGEISGMLVSSLDQFYALVDQVRDAFIAAGGELNIDSSDTIEASGFGDAIGNVDVEPDNEPAFQKITDIEAIEEDIPPKIMETQNVILNEVQEDKEEPNALIERDEHVRDEIDAALESGELVHFQKAELAQTKKGELRTYCERFANFVAQVYGKETKPDGTTKADYINFLTNETQRIFGGFRPSETPLFEKKQKPVEVPEAPEAPEVSKLPEVAKSTASGLHLYVDCVPVNTHGNAINSLDSYIENACDEIARAANVDHILLAGKDSPLAFGGWEGVVSSYVKNKPPKAGHWLILHTRGNKLKEAFVTALLAVADSAVRGV